MTHDPEKVIARALDRFALVESGWSATAIKRAFATKLSAPHNLRQADAILAELADAELVIVPKEPTKAMITAAWAYMVAPGDDTVRAAWGAQLAVWPRHGNAGEDG